MKILLPLFLLLTTVPCFADYTTPGTSVKWTLDDLVTNSSGNVSFSSGEYAVTGIITIATNDTLSITADATVKFALNTHFLVNGTIIIDPPNGVKFTAADQSAGFNGMRLDLASPVCVLRKFTLEYAISLNLRDCSPLIENCTFQYNNNTPSTSPSFGNGAISLSRANPVIKNCTFVYNRRAAIQGAGNANVAPKIIDCYFYANSTTNANVPHINLGSTGTTATDTVKILGNTFIGMYIMSGAISFFPTSNNVYAIISGNVIRKNRYGINLQGGSAINAVVSYNIIDSNNIQNDPIQGGSGIAFAGGSASSQQNSIVTGNIIRGNLWGITIQNRSKPNLGNLANADTTDDGKNWFYGNSNTNSSTPGIHLYNNSIDVISAQGNYWGSNDPLEMEARIFHQPDNASLGLVDYSNYALPVSLLSFNASVTDKKVLLQWKTATETNSAHFEIEKSLNGNTYQKTGSVNAAGNSTDTRSYSFIDDKYNNVAIYYRIKIVDRDGRFTYSPVVLIKPIITNAEAVKVFPSFVQQGKPLQLEVNAKAQQSITIRYFDVSGKCLGTSIENVQAGSNQVLLNNIPAYRGKIIIEVSCTEFRKAVPVIIQ